jgi:hypothetical protein
MSFMRNARFALRTLRKSPMFTFVAVTSLAFGIGANTAIFSLINQVLLRTLPVHDPEQLVLLSGEGPAKSASAWRSARNGVTWPGWSCVKS